MPISSKWLYPILIVLISGALIVFAYMGRLELKDVSAALLALLGTFVGALFAFRLDENKDKIKTEREKIRILNKALFVLIRQLNAITLISRDLKKYKTDFELAFNLPAWQPPNYFDVKLDIDGLTFLLSSKYPSVVLELSVEQERFEQAIESMRVRNNFCVGEVQPVISQHRLNGRNVTMEDVKSVMGDRLFWGAINGAKSVLEHVTASEQSIPELHEKLFRLAKELYPNEKFLRLDQNA